MNTHAIILYHIEQQLQAQLPKNIKLQPYADDTQQITYVRWRFTTNHKHTIKSTIIDAQITRGKLKIQLTRPYDPKRPYVPQTNEYELANPNFPNNAINDIINHLQML